MKRMIGLLKVRYNIRRSKITSLFKRIWGIFTRHFNPITEEEFFA